MPPSARKYLSEKNAGYPSRSLPGYPDQATSSKELVIQNSNSTLAHSAWSSLASASSSLPPTLLPYPMPTNELLNSNQRTSLCSRQIKTNPASVDAETVNKNVSGTRMTSEELDKRIKQQIEENIHYLLSDESRKCRSRSRSREPCSHHAERSRSHSHEPDTHHQHHHHDNDHHHKHHHHHQSSSDNHPDHENPHYQLYKRLCDELYASSSHGSSGHQLKKSKSVEFTPLSSHRGHCHHHHHDNEDDYYEIISSRSRDRSNEGRRSRGSTGQVDRFGNPKVSFGLPDRPCFKAVRSKSASASLNSSLSESSTNPGPSRSSKKMFQPKTEMVS